MYGDCVIISSFSQWFEFFSVPSTVRNIEPHLWCNRQQYYKTPKCVYMYLLRSSFYVTLFMLLLYIHRFMYVQIINLTIHPTVIHVLVYPIFYV